jgi:hypothetical protein
MKIMKHQYDGIAHFLEHKLFEQIDGSVMDNIFYMTGASPIPIQALPTLFIYFPCTESSLMKISTCIWLSPESVYNEESVEKERV